MKQKDNFKIGILTYHRVINDGAILQAYSTQKILNKKFPHAKVEIIDYYPTKLLFREAKSLIMKRPPFFRKRSFNKIRSVLAFIDKYLKLSKESQMTNKTEKAAEFINSQDYDVIFVGSDTVWEGRFGKYVPHPPNIYYLPNVNGTKKVSFAASADPLKPDFVNDEKLTNLLASHLKDLDHITVRDKTTTDYLVGLGIAEQKIHYMPDPTLQTNIKELVEKPNLSNSKPLAGISLGGEVRDQIKDQLKENGFNIIDLRKYTFNGKVKPEFMKSVNKRLGIFSKLDFLVTDRFHSSIFTLTLAKSPVIFVETIDKWPLKNSKGRDLFERLELEEMVWRYSGNEIPKKLVSEYLKKWDDINPNIDEQVSKLQILAKRQMEKIKSLL